MIGTPFVTVISADTSDHASAVHVLFRGRLLPHANAIKCHHEAPVRHYISNEAVS